MRSDKEIAELAFDIAGGRVFTTWHMPKGESNLSMVFLPLALMDEKAMEDFKAAKPVMLYEYLDKAGPRSVNGMPCFFSVRMVNADEGNRLLAKLREIDAFKEKLAAPSDATPPTAEPKTAG